MASLDSLPPDQRAVLQLVLQRGRSYDQIAQLLSIDRDVVRTRALAALEAIGPDTRVADDRRALISDYLLGQLADDAAGQARTELATSAGSRAWARVVASELAPLAANPLPEILVEQAEPVAATESPAAAEPAAAPAATGQAAMGEPAAPVAAAAEAPVAAASAADEPSPPPAPRSSRTGGAILLGIGALVALIVVGVVIVLVANSGGSSHHATTAANTPTATTTATTAASTSGATPVAAVALKSPSHAKGTAGFAEVVRQGGKTGLVLVAQGIPANSTHDAYAVWLYNSPSDNRIVGFVSPGVNTDGKLQTAGVLPTNAAHFRQLLVTLETQARPHGPGKIVLQGPFKLAQ